MARKVFFSFHWERDVNRAMVVRNSWVARGGAQAAGFFDHADIEKIKRADDAQVKTWIRQQLVGASVTCVLIGPETASRKFVRYEIEQSVREGKGLLGIYVNKINTFGASPFDQLLLCPNPFDQIHDSTLGALYIGSPMLSRRVRTYDWVRDSGFHNFSYWVEQAARDAGR